MADQSQRLQRFAEAHVVGENAAEAVLPEEHQPVEPVPLVGAKLDPHPRRRLQASHLAGRQQAADLLAPHRRLMVDNAEPGQFFPQSGLISADPQLAHRRFLQRPGLLDQPAQRLQLGLV